MVVEEKTVARKKPKFLRTDWHKKIRLGRGLKKKQKWHGAKGRHNKFRLNRKGRGVRPKIGWGAPKGAGGRGEGVGGRYVCNLKDLVGVKKSEGILIGSVGMKKRKEIIAEANKMGLKILNKYLVMKNETRTNADGRGQGSKEKVENKSKSGEEGK